MAPERTVQCPECGDEKTTRGKESFRCCGSYHNITKHKVIDVEPGQDAVNPDDLLGTDKEVTMSDVNQPQDEDDEPEPDIDTDEARPDEGEHEYTCMNCDGGFDRKLVSCPHCGQRFKWSEM